MRKKYINWNSIERKKKGKRNIDLLERIHNLGTEISLKRRNENDRSSTIRERAHESTNGCALGSAGGGYDNEINRQRLLSQPRLEPILQFPKPRQ